MKPLSPAEQWLAISITDDPDLFVLDFQEHHIGNPIIRSVHGGVVGALIECAAEKALINALKEKGLPSEVEVTTASIDYLRVTKDAPLYARVNIVRIARRIAFLDVKVWQDNEELPVSRGSCTLRILDTTNV